MKIIRSGKTVSFENLEEGDKFTFGENLYMKYAISEDSNCVDLDSGQLKFVPKGKQVVQVVFGDVELINV